MIDTKIVLEGKRIRLRYLNKNDTEAIFHNINNDRTVLKYFIDKYVDSIDKITLDKTIDFCINNDRYLMAIELKESSETIGMILQCSSPNKVFNISEIGFAIGRKHWNKGYVTEALALFKDFLFSLGIHKLICSHIVGNIGSKRVIEKNGFIYEGRRVQEIYYHDIYFDVDYYYLLNENLENKG